MKHIKKALVLFVSFAYTLFVFLAIIIGLSTVQTAFFTIGFIVMVIIPAENESKTISHLIWQARKLATVIYLIIREIKK